MGGFSHFSNISDITFTSLPLLPASLELIPVCSGSSCVNVCAVKGSREWGEVLLAAALRQALPLHMSSHPSTLAPRLAPATLNAIDNLLQNDDK